MRLTEDMKERMNATHGEWKDEGNGYASMIGCGCMGVLAYIRLPARHPDIGKSYDDVDAPVNGGLTYGGNRIYGWDYMHAYNSGTPECDIEKALKFFRKRQIRFEERHWRRLNEN